MYIHCGKILNNLFACSKVPSCKKSENEACVQFVYGTAYIPTGCIFYYTVSLTVQKFINASTYCSF